MSEYGHAFSGLAKEHKLTDQELIRAIRFITAAEYEAIQLYMQLAESIDNELAIEALKDIADEERVHAGEFLRLFKELDSDGRSSTLRRRRSRRNRKIEEVTG